MHNLVGLFERQYNQKWKSCGFWWINDNTHIFCFGWGQRKNNTLTSSLQDVKINLQSKIQCYVNLSRKKKRRRSRFCVAQTRKRTDLNTPASQYMIVLYFYLWFTYKKKTLIFPKNVKSGSATVRVYPYLLVQ